MRMEHQGFWKGKLKKNEKLIIILVVVGLLLPPPPYKTEEQVEVAVQNDVERVDEAQEEMIAQSDLDKAQRVEEALDQYLPGIVCWGDSLTAGYGGEGVSYPSTLSKLVNENIIDVLDISYLLEAPEVVNLGVNAESSITIAGRAGGIPYVTAEDIVIPSQVLPVELPFLSEDGKEVLPNGVGYSGLDNITISGISGNIGMESDAESGKRKYYFTRIEAGEEVKVPKGTEIQTYGSTHFLDFFPVIFIGINDGIKELIKSQKAIINHYQKNKENYIIIGIPNGTAEERADLEAAMIDEYGDKYINLREYMSLSGIDDANKQLDAGIKITEHDKEMMAEGKVPASLLIEDEFHFNAYGYELIGELVYNRMNQLGYFDKVRTEIDEIIN